MTQSVLVVAAHPDDEVLGVGGTLLDHVRRGDDVSILILGDGETSRDASVDVEKRVRQAREVGHALGAKVVLLEQLPDNAFDSVPLLQLVKLVEKHVAAVAPSIVYTHHAHDLNVDHRLTFEAVLTACRPHPDACVTQILAFETPSSTEYQVKTPGRIFCPTAYREISDVIEEKMALLRVYDDEMRPYPHPRSYEGVRLLAQYRGMEVGCQFAEAFEVIRSIERGAPKHR